MTSTTPTAPNSPTAGTAPFFAANWHAVTVRYGPTLALDRVTLGVHRGELLAVLGPSGCGKSTLLAALAGTVPLIGRVAIDGVDVTDWPPERRQLGVVFQSYALFPHLTVLENIAFGLTVRNIQRAERNRVAHNWVSRMGMDGLESKYPRELSGGQQQRVALARALAIRPTLVMLDEPFANLDLPLHNQLRLELQAIQRHDALTALLVTHDAADALAADRVAILSAGRLVQVGTPHEVYHRPNNLVAACALGDGVLLTATELGLTGTDLFFRPEDWQLDPPDGPRWQGRVIGCQFAGATWSLTVALFNTTITLITHQPRQPGETVNVGIFPERGWRFPRESAV